VADSRASTDPVGTARSGRSRSSRNAIAANTTSTIATRSNGKLGPNAAASCTVENAEIAVPPIPAPKIPSASPRRSGGYQEFTNGTPIANVVPPRPRKNPPTR
jgi:hypothetical protein